MALSRVASVAALVAALALAPNGADAASMRLVGSIGSSLAASGDPGSGGPALSITSLWEFDPGFEAGLMVFVDDIGNSVGGLVDPNDPSLALGAVQNVERLSYGAAWRVDATRLGSAWEPFASLTMGYYRVQRDRLGVVSRAESATGASLGIGLRRLIGPSASLGLSARYHQLTNDDLEHYMQVTLDGSVRIGN